MKKIRSLLVANRSEIAIRVMRAASEMGIRTVAIYSNEDRFALHRFKADESYLVGAGKKPIQAYLDIDDIIRVAKEAHVDAIHPGYGFLSENPDFADACAAAGIVFIGPKPAVMRLLGNKVSARELAEKAGVPVVPATGALPHDLAAAKKMAAAVGYPLMLKASWGGGGRGMRVVETEADLGPAMEVARREAAAAFGNDEVYLEKLVRRARHVEVQVIGDTPRQPGAPVRARLLGAAAQPEGGGTRAGALSRRRAPRRTVRVGPEAGPRRELHPRRHGRVPDGRRHRRVLLHRGQPAHPGRAHRHRAGDRRRHRQGADPHLRRRAHRRRRFLRAAPGRHPACTAMPCSAASPREDPENGFTPDYGRISVYRSAAGFGIRLDGGTAYAGAVITPYYDSLLVKVTAWGHTPDEAAARMDRALREFRVRGVASNLQFLENVIDHPLFRSGECTTRFIDETPELFNFQRRRDRGTQAAEVPRRGGGQRQPGDEGPRPAAAAAGETAQAALRPAAGAAARHARPPEGTRRRRSSPSG